MSEAKSEGKVLLEVEKLLDGLPDDAARQRVVDWARNKYSPKSEPVKTAPFIPQQLGPAVNPPPWLPVRGIGEPYHNIGGPPGSGPRSDIVFRS